MLVDRCFPNHLSKRFAYRHCGFLDHLIVTRAGHAYDREFFVVVHTMFWPHLASAASHPTVRCVIRISTCSVRTRVYPFSLVAHLALLVGLSILLAILLFSQLEWIEFDACTYLGPRWLCVFSRCRGARLLDGSGALHKPHSARRFARPRRTRRAGSAQKDASHLQQCARLVLR